MFRSATLKPAPNIELSRTPHSYKIPMTSLAPRVRVPRLRFLSPSSDNWTALHLSGKPRRVSSTTAVSIVSLHRI